jgi:hypothetical protein
MNHAYQVVTSLAGKFSSEWNRDEQVCFIIAGDIVYNMAHDVPRPERSTGRLVNGSDMDIVVIVDDHFPAETLKELDEAIYQEKYRLLITPHIREEIDYVTKRLERVREQVKFDSFRHMVACKILQEGTLLYGSETLFSTVKKILQESGVTAKLQELESCARDFRIKAEEYLLQQGPHAFEKDEITLFYPSEESEEFE